MGSVTQRPLSRAFAVITTYDTCDTRQQID